MRSSRSPGSRSSSRDVRSFSDARFGCSWSRPADIRCSSTTRSPSSSSSSSLPRRDDAGERPPLERVQRRVERLERVDAGRERGLDRLARAARAASRRATISISGSSGIAHHSRVIRAWIPGCSGRRRRSRAARSASWRRSSRSPRRRATSTAPRSARRSAPRCCPPTPRWSGRRAPPPSHAPDLLARVRGSGTRRLVLLGHTDTVIAHAHHKPLRRDGEHLLGSGAVDMKGGVVLALGVLRALAGAARRLRRGGAAARVRRGVADGAVRAHGALRRLGRVPVLRGRRADAGRRRGRRRAAQGRRHDQGAREGPRRALRLRARPRPQRAARAGHRRAGGRRVPRARRPGPPHRRARRSCTPATRSTSSPAAASWCATCAPTTTPRSSACSTRSPPTSAASRSTPELMRLWPGMDAEAATVPLLERASAALGPSRSPACAAAARATRATSRP